MHAGVNVSDVRPVADEIARLSAVCNLKLLDTPPQEAFDRVTRLAAQAIGVPIVLVSLIDETRQWFLSKFGLDATQTPREISFCAQVVHTRSALCVPDTATDSRFAANPMVTGPPHIRAYLGIPLTARSGHVVGTLCAIDRRPREFDPAALRTFSDFARIVEETIQARELSVQIERALKLATEQQALFRDTFEYAGVGITHTSLQGELIRINRHACELLGYSMSEIKRHSFLDITHPDDAATNMELFQQLSAGQISQFQIEKRYVRKDGTFFWAHLSAALKYSACGGRDYIISVIEDISARKQAETDLLVARDSLQKEVAQQTKMLQDSNRVLNAQIRRLMESERTVRQVEHRLRSIANNVPAMIGYWNRELRCEFANQAYKDWFGRDPQQIIGMTMRELLGDAHFGAIELYRRLVLQGHPQCFERSMKKVNGELTFLEVRYLPDCDEAGDVRGFFVHATDMTQSCKARAELEEANARLSVDSSMDYLTSLANRRSFSEQSETALRRYREEGEMFGLILLDLDHFKRINDVHGHAVGDEVLRRVGRVLNSQLRNHRDVAARLGGEEFGVLCFGALDEHALLQVAERIRDRLSRETIVNGGDELRFTASFGLSIVEPDDVSSKSLFTRADAALYQAKAEGRNRLVFSSTLPPGAANKPRG